ncbi:MAG: Crp/Fnr family transcriptional regulator [Burkholderiaceae bacterium]|nr:Crp/Fnr family transcriptional regulator [Burkholderiaceae bacterium]
MNDLAMAPPMPARLPASTPAAASPALGRSLWHRLLDATPLMTTADVQALDALTVQRVLAAGDWVFTHRTPARALVLLLEGTVSLGHSDGAAMAPERLLRGPAWLDAASAWLAGTAHALDARATGMVRVAEMPRAALQTLLMQRPALAPGFLAVLAEQVQHLSLQTHELMHKDANSRLAAWLHRHLPSSPGAPALLHLNERKRDIAAQLGMSPETLSRQMRQLSRCGLIEVRGYQVLVLDSAGLQRLATS